MSVTRKNHYVPVWYQRGFWEPGKTTLSYYNLSPAQFTRSDGTIGFRGRIHDAPPSRAFFTKDLYSTFFGTSINDEIERKLFGDIDARGSIAVKAFANGNPVDCHNNFSSFFEFMDIQKLRTPKGLKWLRGQYPFLTQNELMMELQAMRMMHCTIWTECVREIISAKNSKVKFIISDHPVTVYNRALPPGSQNGRTREPGIELVGTQTIFPLNREKCLILTNLEHAKNPSCDGLDKRTFSRLFRQSLVRTDSFIRNREFSESQVIRINRIIGSGAKQYIGAGKREWIPNPVDNTKDWIELGQDLIPSLDALFGFDGETFVGYEDGRVYYQDAFGRTEKPRSFLQKEVASKRLKSSEYCGCGSGKNFSKCCKLKPIMLRPSWEQLSIRERNIALLRGIENILDLRADMDWIKVRKSITDEKISEIYSKFPLTC